MDRASERARRIRFLLPILWLTMVKKYDKFACNYDAAFKRARRVLWFRLGRATPHRNFPNASGGPATFGVSARGRTPACLASVTMTFDFVCCLFSPIPRRCESLAQRRSTHKVIQLPKSPPTVLRKIIVARELFGRSGFDFGALRDGLLDWGRYSLFGSLCGHFATHNTHHKK